MVVVDGCFFTTGKSLIEKRTVYFCVCLSVCFTLSLSFFLLLERGSDYFFFCSNTFMFSFSFLYFAPSCFSRSSLLGVRVSRALRHAGALRDVRKCVFSLFFFLKEENGALIILVVVHSDLSTRCVAPWCSCLCCFCSSAFDQ